MSCLLMSMTSTTHWKESQLFPLDMKPNPRHQAFAGDIVHYLFEAAIARNEDLGIIIRKLVEAARYLDSNFPDLEVPTLRGRLLLKVMQAEKLAQELNRTLSALETFITDWEISLGNITRVLLARKEEISGSSS
jgi:hypothetical protein